LIAGTLDCDASAEITCTDTAWARHDRALVRHIRALGGELQRQWKVRSPTWG
jgi:hypothetical protein